MWAGFFACLFVWGFFKCFCVCVLFGGVLFVCFLIKNPHVKEALQSLTTSSVSFMSPVGYSLKLWEGKQIASAQGCEITCNHNLLKKKMQKMYFSCQTFFHPTSFLYVVFDGFVVFF